MGLGCRAGRCFQGPIPVGAGFILTDGEAKELLSRHDADYQEVVRPYLTGEDIARRPDQSPSRWVIDFGVRSLEESNRFPAALKRVRERVKPERDGNRDPGFRQLWWRFGRPRIEMREALARISRFAAGTATGKRLFMDSYAAAVCPSNLTNVFAFAGDFSMGVLQSRAHVAWAWARSSTLETRLRYTPTSVFMTFPWPDRASEKQRETVADACRRLLARRSERCLEHNVGLTKLYNAMDEGA